MSVRAGLQVAEPDQEIAFGEGRNPSVGVGDDAFEADDRRVPGVRVAVAVDGGTVVALGPAVELLVFTGHHTALVMRFEAGARHVSSQRTQPICASLPAERFVPRCLEIVLVEAVRVPAASEGEGETQNDVSLRAHGFFSVSPHLTVGTINVNNILYFVNVERNFWCFSLSIYTTSPRTHINEVGEMSEILAREKEKRGCWLK